MKTALSDYGLRRIMREKGMNYLDACDLVKKLGFDAIEFTQLKMEFQEESDFLTLAWKIKEHCQEIGLPVACYTVSPDPLKFAREAITEQVDICAVLGAPVMRYNAFRACPEGMTCSGKRFGLYEANN